HRIQQEVALVAGFAGHVELRDQFPAVDAAHVEVDVRRAARIRHGPDRPARPGPVVAGADLTAPLEAGVAPPLAAVSPMAIDPVRIALPDLDEGSGQRPSVDVDDTSANVSDGAQRARRFATDDDEVGVGIAAPVL